MKRNPGLWIKGKPVGYQVVGDSIMRLKHVARRHLETYLVVLSDGRCLCTESLDDDLVEMAMEGDITIIKMEGSLAFRLSKDAQGWDPVDDLSEVELVVEE